MEPTDDPLIQFEAWYQQALKSDEADPEAMALATVSSDSKPSVRIVLYKGISEGGFIIYTNYKSRKALELLKNPHAALVIYWPRCYRQVRIEGQMVKVSVDESENYFRHRPRESQIAASISEQSHEIPDRDYLIEKYTQFERDYADKQIPCPSYWGGLRLNPDKIEFWQGRPHRLHDRICYLKQDEGWRMVRLAP